MNWLHGKPSTLNPRGEYVLCSFSRPSNWGVNPHLLAVFTMSTTLSFNWAKSKDLPCGIAAFKS